VSDRKILDRIAEDTKVFKARIHEQIGLLEKLKTMGEDLKEMTGEDDPLIGSIDQTIDAISGIEEVAKSLENLKLPEV